MSRTAVILAILSVCIVSVPAATIVDHTCTDLTAIPQSAIQAAKTNLIIAYGHTSHGSQLTDGMSGLVGFINGGGLGLSYPVNFFAWNGSGSGGALQLRDYAFGAYGADDLGAPDRTAWATATRNYLTANPAVNVVIWSWCGQVSTATTADINTYLGLMNQLEIDYPAVKFVYMTGHLDGGGAAGSLNVNNQQIRDYCSVNNKTLYDFADIESYDPDGLVNYMLLMCNDNCDYVSGGSHNWALEWQAAHTQNVDWYVCSAAHSQSLNGNRKAYAAWWLWARLAGWNPVPCAVSPSNLIADYNDVTRDVTLTWQDNSSSPQEDYFVIQRQTNGGAWNNLYASVGQNLATFSENLPADGTYAWRIAAHMNDNGGGISCDSSPSNVATVVISTAPPAAPSSLQCSLIDSNDIRLTWDDNSSDEEAFILERSIDGGSFAVLTSSILPDAESYIDLDLPVKHTYGYRIMARNANGDSGYSNTVYLYIPVTTNTVRFQTTTEVDDSFIWSSNPTTNYGSSQWAADTLHQNHRFIVKFNTLSTLSGKRIIDAKLYLYGWQQSGYSSGLYMQLYRLTRNWTEMGVTWNSASAGVPWTTAGSDYAEQVGQVQVTAIDHLYYPPADVTTVVGQWVRGDVPNYGLVLINANTTFRTNLKASEYSSGRPYLDVTYSDACPVVYAADFNADCSVDFRDVAIMAQYWGLSNAAVDIAPAGGDGIINVLDLAALTYNWLGCQCP